MDAVASLACNGIAPTSCRVWATPTANAFPFGIFGHVLSSAAPVAANALHARDEFFSLFRSFSRFVYSATVPFILARCCSHAWETAKQRRFYKRKSSARFFFFPLRRVCFAKCTKTPTQYYVAKNKKVRIMCTYVDDTTTHPTTPEGKPGRENDVTRASYCRLRTIFIS